MKKTLVFLLILVLLASFAAVSAEDEIHYGGTLRMAITTLNHLDTNSIAAEYEPYYMVYETLFGDEPDATITPLLVVSYEVSDDGKIYTLHLHQGIKFHDGTDFNAEAVKWNLDRKIEQELPYSNNIPWDSIDVLDEYTVQIKLTRHYLPILYYLSNPSFSMYSPTFVETHTADDLKNQAVGTGAYIIDEYRPNDFLRVVKNPNYWQEGKPYLDAIEFYIIPDINTRMMALESGEVDLLKDITIQDLIYLQDQNYENITVTYGPAVRTHYIALHNQYEPLNIKEVRQAFNYAVDKEGMNASIFNNLYHIETDLVCSTELTNGFMYNEPYEYNPEKAKELMDSVGFVDTDGDGYRDWNGEPREFLMYSMKGRRTGDIEIAEQVQAFLKDVGVKVVIEIMDPATYLDTINQDFGKAPHYDMANMSPGGNGDKEYSVNNYLSCDAWPGKSYNYSHYCNEEVQKLIEDAREATSFEARNAIFDELTPIIWDDCPVIFLVDIIYTGAYNSSLRNIYGLPDSVWLIRDAYFAE